MEVRGRDIGCRTNRQGLGRIDKDIVAARREVEDVVVAVGRCGTTKHELIVACIAKEDVVSRSADKCIRGRRPSNQNVTR